MSNHDDGYQKPTGSMRPSQSMWMNRWMTTSSNSTLPVPNHFSLQDESRGKDLDLKEGARLVQIAEPSMQRKLDINATPCNISEYRNSWRCQGEDIVVATNVPRSVKPIEVVTEAKRVAITYETLVTNSRKRDLINSRLELQPMSMINFSEKFGSILAQKRLAVSFEHESNTQTDVISKHRTIMEPSNFPFPFKTLRSAPTEIAFRVKGCHSVPESRLQLAEPYISVDRNRMRNGEPGDRMHSFTSTGLPPSHSCPGQVRGLNELNTGCNSPSNVPRPVHQIDKLRLFSSLGSVEGVSRGPQVLQKKNHLSITEGNQITRVQTISTKLKESASLPLFTLLPDFNCNDEHSEKLQPLGSSRDGEGKNDVKDETNASLVSNNESSAETDTMDINVSQTGNSLPSRTLSPSYKDTMVGKNPAIYQSTIMREKLGSRRAEIELPNINDEPPSSFAAEQEIGNMDLSPSRTESLDVEQLLVDQVGNSNSSAPHYPTLIPDPSSRWVKRLKLSSSDYQAHGTKKVTIGNSSFTAKIDKSYDKITYHNRTSSRPIFGELFGELFGEEAEQMELDKTLLSLGNKESASMDTMKESSVLNLSHPWIRRWCYNQAPCPQMKSVAPGACQLDSSNTALYQTKQFPSIAAMALMGKTMNGLQACKVQNKGSFVVWGTGGF